NNRNIQQLNSQWKDEKSGVGKADIIAGIKEMGYRAKEILTEINLTRVWKKFNVMNEDDLYAAVGYEGIAATLILSRLTDKIRKEETVKQDLAHKIEEIQETVHDRTRALQKSETGVYVKGLDNVLIRLSRCCNPVPYDDII